MQLVIAEITTAPWSSSTSLPSRRIVALVDIALATGSGACPPVLLCGHTPPYYQGFIERYGFAPARGDNLAYAVDLGEDTPALRRLARLADRLRTRERIAIREADLEHWEDEIDRVYHLLGKALAHLPDYVPWRRSEVQALLEPFHDAIDPELVLFADVDGMKDINDCHGHNVGDEALRTTARVLTDAFRESDIIARIGGDEFTVLMLESAENHRSALRDPLPSRQQLPVEYRLHQSLASARSTRQH